MDEKITVIIPVFNGEENIRNTISSVINQSFGFENIELIIVDDCSTDNTRDILKEYSDKYPNIRCFFLKKNNGAAGKGRNVGLENASGEYVMFLDSDDEYAEDMCEVMYSTITRENVDFVMCRYDMYVDGEFVDHNKSFLSEYERETKVTSLTDNLEMISTCANLVIWNKIYNKKFLLSNEMTFVNDKFNEDFLFSHEAFLCCDEFISLNHFYGYKYHIHSASASNAGSEKFFDDGLFVLRKVEELFEKKHFNNYEVLNEYVVIQTQGMLNSGLSNPQKKKFFKQMAPYYKRYKLSYRLINKVSLPFNIAINICIKLFALSPSFAVLTSKIYGKIFSS